MMPRGFALPTRGWGPWWRRGPWRSRRCRHHP